MPRRDIPKERTLDPRITLLRSIGARTSCAVKSFGSSKDFGTAGFNMIRSHRMNGMGVHAALMDRVLRDTGLPVQTLEFDDQTPPTRPPDFLYPATISAVTPGHIVFSELQYPRAFSRHKKRAAAFSWDVDVIPRRLRAGFPLLDEVWALSSMGQNYLSQATSTPVHLFPTPISRPEEPFPGSFRTALSLGDKFVVAYQFDIGSSARRKNARAAIEIYRNAFPHEKGDTHLIMKCTRADVDSAEWRELELARGSRSDISLINDFWTRDFVDAMYADIDCYLSPHRSEGYGLTVAEALSHGVFVIATAYGGPMDFMSPDNCGFIPFRMVEVGPDPIYPAKARWAEPDINDGADLLRDAYFHRDKTQARASAAREEALSRFTVERAVNWIRDRVPQ
jgi:hypothetical protein